MLGLSAPIHAYDVTDNLSVGGVLSAAGQCQSLQDDAAFFGVDFDDECKGATPNQP